ncbi:hypothetical protein [Kitasatospora sp. NPDC059327]|uniref:hypothetical protein n=1 Tax=Kitasatospora sp. NPDC059327 TaxID=3346803 RepID=UPI003690895D
MSGFPTLGPPPGAGPSRRPPPTRCAAHGRCRHHPGTEDSVENASNSTVGVWVYPWLHGDANYVRAGRGGGPTSNLRNNEASWGMVDQLNRGGHLRLD